MTNPALSDESKAVLDEIESLLEPSGSGSTEDNTDNSGEGGDGKSGDNSTIRQMRSALKKAYGELKNRPTDQATGSTEQPKDQPPSNVNQAAMLDMHFMSRAREEMLKAGTDPDAFPGMTQAIYNRLFNEHLDGMKAQASAKQNAGGVFDTVAGEFEVLKGKEDDLKQIKEQVSELDVLSQANDQAVRSIFHQYIGANLSRFSSNGQATDGKAKTDTSGGAAASAASAAKRGRGLQLSDGGDTGKGEPVKAATKEEVVKMRKMNLDPGKVEDIKRFRTAEANKGAYAGRVE